MLYFLKRTYFYYLQHHSRCCLGVLKDQNILIPYPRGVPPQRIVKVIIYKLVFNRSQREHKGLLVILQSGSLPGIIITSLLFPVSDHKRGGRMGKKDVTVARYFEDRERYADLLNVYIFGGAQTVKKEDIIEKDARVAGIFGRAENFKKRLFVQKFRDAVRRVVFGTEIVVVGLEHQAEVHYAMPVRIMVEDALEYDNQLQKIQKRHRRRRDLKGAEYLGGFGKEDRLRPVVSIVLYYGEEVWDGAKELHDLMNLDAIPEGIRSFVNSYPLHILEVRYFQGTDRFKTDLREVFGFIKRAGSKAEIRSFTEERREQFEHLDEDAYDMIAVLTGSEELQEKKDKNREEGGTINMCQAIREMVEEGKLEGKIEGKLEGKLEGEEKMARLVLALQQTGASEKITLALTDKAAREQLYKEYHIN